MHPSILRIPSILLILSKNVGVSVLPPSLRVLRVEAFVGNGETNGPRDQDLRHHFARRKELATKGTAGDYKHGVECWPTGHPVGFESNCQPVHRPMSSARTTRAVRRRSAR